MYICVLCDPTLLDECTVPKLTNRPEVSSRTVTSGALSVGENVLPDARPRLSIECPIFRLSTYIYTSALEPRQPNQYRKFFINYLPQTDSLQAEQPMKDELTRPRESNLFRSQCDKRTEKQIANVQSSAS